MDHDDDNRVGPTLYYEGLNASRALLYCYYGGKGRALTVALGAV